MSNIATWKIKCIRCKKDMTQKIDSNIRLCNMCRFNNGVQSRKRQWLKRKEERQALKKLKPEYYHKTCPVCEREFKTKICNKKYCTKKCTQQPKKLPVQLENSERNLIKLEVRQIKVNEIYQEKFNKLQEQLDHYNKGADKQIEVYKKNILRIEKILSLTDK